MKEINFNKVRVEIDLLGNFISLETINHRLIASSEWALDSKNDDMYISDFKVVERYRGKGYGSFLARIIFGLARLYKVDTVSLIDGSSLEGFWQRLGFKWDKVRESWVLWI
jgi:predicted acetyltransferase